MVLDTPWASVTVPGKRNAPPAVRTSAWNWLRIGHRTSPADRDEPARIAAEMDGNLVVRVAACAAPEQGDLCAARAWPTSLTGAWAEKRMDSSSP
jgi:hypothetical protein